MGATRRLSAGFFFALFGAAFVWALRAALAPAPAGAELPAWRRDPATVSAIARAARRADALSGAVARALAEHGIGRGDVRYESVAPAVPANDRFFPRTEMALDVAHDAAALAEALEEVVRPLDGATVRREPRAEHERFSFRLDGTEVVSVELHPLRLPAGTSDGPRIAVIIDDVGYVREPVFRLLGLAPETTFAVLPYGPHAATLADEIHAQGGEVMLHLPMQPAGKPGGFSRDSMLLASMGEMELVRTLAEALVKVPHVTGVNNHMGSVLTADPDAMKVVMRELAERRLFFVDSRTSAQTVAYRIAREAGVPSAERDVFLDDVAETRKIEAELARLEALAKKHGSAIAIGHPYPETVEALMRWIPTLEEKGIELVRVSKLAGLAAPPSRPGSGWRSAVPLPANGSGSYKNSVAKSRR